VSSVGIVGSGRAGVALGLALSRAGHAVSLHGRRQHELSLPFSYTWGDAPPWLAAVEVILLAVPDDAVASVAQRLAATGEIGAGHTVLHLSGVLGDEALVPLADSGAALGSLHPFQTLASPADAAERLRGAVAGVSGGKEAVITAAELARSIGLTPVPIAADKKALYHAAAVFASNYLVTLEGVAEGLLEKAGLSATEAREALGPLMRVSLENALGVGPERALTGPIVRADLDTIQRHLESLPAEAAELYRELARAALRLADLSAKQRAAIESALEQS